MTVHGTALSIAPRAVIEGTVVAVLVAIIGVRQGFGVGTAALAGLVVLAVALGSTIAHELGHAVAARRARLAVVALRIEGLLGGTVQRETTPSAGAELLICLAGPAVTLRLAAVGGLIALLADGTSAALGLCLAVVNALALVGCFLPLSGSDAGRALAAARRRRIETA